MSIETLKLTFPLLVNGVNKTELTYDIEAVTVEGVAKAESCKAKFGVTPVGTVAQTDFLLHICLGMQAVLAVNNDITEDDLYRLRQFDVCQLAGVGTRFFIRPKAQEQKTLEEPREITQESSTVQSKTVVTLPS